MALGGGAGLCRFETNVQRVVAVGVKRNRAAENRLDSMRLLLRFMMFMMNNRDSSYLSLPEEQEGQRRHLVNNCWHRSSFTLIAGAWINGVIHRL